MNCPQCGAALKNQVFCHECGTFLTPPPKPKDPPLTVHDLIDSPFADTQVVIDLDAELLRAKQSKQEEPKSPSQVPPVQETPPDRSVKRNAVVRMWIKILAIVCGALSVAAACGILYYTL